ncbi:MAG: hypothetical protein AB1635_05530 [Acidobacteriota bacterium]
MRNLLIAVAAILAWGFMDAQQQPARAPVNVSALGPQVGEPVPDFRLPDQSGRTWTLADVMGPEGAMLVFYRSADW